MSRTRSASPPLTAKTLVPINISYQAHGDNEPLSDNKKKVLDGSGGLKDEWMPGKGKRIFPDAKDPGGSARDTVDVKVNVGVPNMKVYLRVMDIDDPTPLEVDTDAETGATNIIDWNDNIVGLGAGVDNDDSDPILWVGDGSDTLDCITDEDGVAKFGNMLPQLRVGMHPGDNYRIAVAVGEDNAGQLSQLQTTFKSSANYVSSGEEQPERFNGAVSEMLTVWRKLHVEQDSMLWPSTKPAPDRQTVTGGSWTTGSAGAGSVTAITCNLGQGVDANFYEGGRVVGGGTEYKIRRGDAHPAGSSIAIKLDHTLSPAETAAFNLSSFEVYDDDDKPLPSGVTAPLPQSGLLTNYAKAVFQPAYIDMVEGPSSYNNADVPFLLNQSGSTLGAGVEGKATLSNSVNYWGTTLTAGYQNDIYGDADPGVGGASESAETDTTKGISLIYFETIRDEVGKIRVQSGNPVPEFYLDEDYYNRLLRRTVPHEIGHIPQSGLNGNDHSEGGLMNPESLQPEGDDPEFSPTSISRMREADSWRN